MYCPVCLNDTLKIASSGVIKMTFNGKAKSTSQFFYDLNSDRESDICEKLEKVIVDYFSYYSTFQNKSPVQHIEAFSIDFKCSNKCVINFSHKMNVIGLVFSKKMLEEAVKKNAIKFNIPLDLKLNR